MSKILAIMGSYRLGKTMDKVVDVMLEEARHTSGVETEKIILLHHQIEFCNNCRSCTHESALLNNKAYGKCVFKDDMEKILEKIEAADALIFASPVNCYTVNALTKRFIERLICYADWPWGTQGGPKLRIKKRTKKALVISSTAMPWPFGYFFTNAIRLLKGTAETVGAKVVGTMMIGMSGLEKDEGLREGTIRDAKRIVHKIIIAS